MKRWLCRVAIFSILIAVASNFSLPSQEMKSLPATAGEWRLIEQTILQPVPPELKYFRGARFARKAWRGTYSGPYPVAVTVFETPRGGFDIIQQWQVIPGKLAFAWGCNVGVAESPGAAKKNLRSFVLALYPKAPLELMR